MRRIQIFVLSIALSLVFAVLFSLTTTAQEEPPAAQPSELNWEASYAEAMKKAKNENKPLLVFVYESGKKLCEAMENNIFTNPKISKYLENFVCYKEARVKGQG
ncbi:MAG: DUF255 domain-containing protein, partial [Planctomycetota bacterium]